MNSHWHITIIGLAVLVAFALLMSNLVITQENVTGNNLAAAAKNQPAEKYEEYKKNARRVGGSAFSAPVIDGDKIARLPSAVTTYQGLQKKRKNVAEFKIYRPVIVDVNTIRSGNRTVTLANITPLPVDETCENDGESIPCGRMARTALRALVRSRTLNCLAQPKADESNIISTSCRVGKIDLAKWLIDQNWVKPEK